MVVDTRVAQVHLVFTISEAVSERIFDVIPIHNRPRYLAYVEWFSPLPRQVHADTGMYPITRSYDGGDRLCSVIDIRRIVRSAHLLPKYGVGQIASKLDWTSSDVLDRCTSFWLNNHSDLDMFQHLST